MACDMTSLSGDESDQPGRLGTMTHDYKRHGTTTLFAAQFKLWIEAVGGGAEAFFVNLSIGTETGPPIGIEKGPFSDWRSCPGSGCRRESGSP